MFIIPDEVSKHENVFDVLKERGFIEQTTHEDEIRELLANQKIKFYIGFDPTADSLHVGHFMQIIIMMYMQKFGHTPIVLVGGGTGMVGDPSGRTDMRKMMTVETVREHCRKFEKLFERFIDFSDNKAIAINNADWLMNLNYIDFLREIGSQFSVNRMLSAECFKQRLEKGLSFLEFNYMLMQAYDFLVLYRNLDCKMQFGGDDQWSNILAGVDLVRRKEQGQVFGMTFALLTNSQGKKMGKTASGALWLDENKTSAYEFYQYWRNVEDEDVNKCLKMLTFLSIEEIEAMTCEKGENINKAKEVLAYEVTKLVHGEEVAKNTETAVKAAFSGEGDLVNLPTTVITEDEAKSGIGLIDLMKRADLISSNSEGFRLVKQGGVSIGDEKVTDGKRIIMEKDFADNSLVIKKGKKVYHRIVID